MALTLLGQHHSLASSTEQLKMLGRTTSYPPFETQLDHIGLLPLRATGITVFQINVGKLCNQTCRHCHVDAGPDRTESMSIETAEQCIRTLAKTDIPTVDITGGAPELNPNFRWLVEQSRALDRHVMDRCNLSVLLLPSQADLAEFFVQHRVEVIASLPYFRPAQTDAQRGDGVFAKSVRALQLLNSLGYGVEGSGLMFHLVHNPVGAFLPPKQEAIEARFRQALARQYGIAFNHLSTITNMPISRFLDFLLASGNYEGYMARLAKDFNPASPAAVLRRYILSVGWQGTLYACELNKMLKVPLADAVRRPNRD